MPSVADALRDLGEGSLPSVFKFDVLFTLLSVGKMLASGLGGLAQAAHVNHTESWGKAELLAHD